MEAETVTTNSSLVNITGVMSASSRRKLPRNCSDTVLGDLVMTFPKQEGHFGGANLRTQSDIIARMVQAGLQVEIAQSRDDDEVFVHISAGIDRLEEEATDMQLMVQLNKPFLTVAHAPFRVDKRTLFARPDDPDATFTSLERSQIIRSIVAKPHWQGGAAMDLEALVMGGTVTQVFTAHCSIERKWLVDNWGRSLSSIPINEIRDYFGDKIALYFAWLAIYTSFLLPLAIVGIVVFLYQGSLHDSKAGHGHLWLLWFSVLVLVSSSLWEEVWKRTQAALTFIWDTRDFEGNEAVRPEFFGDVKQLSPGGEVHIERKVYPTWKRALTHTLVSLPLILITLSVVCTATISIVAFRPSLQSSMSLGDTTARTLCAVMNGLFILLANQLYSKLAITLTDWENWRTDREYEDAMIAKTFVFQLVNSYASLFYIAFAKGHLSLLWIDSDSETCLPDEGTGAPNCMWELSLQLGAIFMTQMLVGQLVEVGLPLVHFHVAKAAESREMRPFVKMKDEEGAVVDVADPMAMSEAERQAKLPLYPGTFPEYNEMIVQWGYVMLFAAAFPLGAALALLNNWVEMRSDALKLLLMYQRPAYQQGQGIGTWQDILMVMSFVGVLTNASLIAFTTKIMETHHLGSSPFEKLVSIFAVEHLVIFIKFVIQWFIADESDAVTKAKLIHKEALGKGAVFRDSESSSAEKSSRQSWQAAVDQKVTSIPACQLLLNKQPLPTDSMLMQEVKSRMGLENQYHSGLSPRRYSPVKKGSP